MRKGAGSFKKYISHPISFSFSFCSSWFTFLSSPPYINDINDNLNIPLLAIQAA